MPIAIVEVHLLALQDERANAILLSGLVPVLGHLGPEEAYLAH